MTKSCSNVVLTDIGCRTANNWRIRRDQEQQMEDKHERKKEAFEAYLREKNMVASLPGPLEFSTGSYNKFDRALVLLAYVDLFD